MAERKLLGEILRESGKITTEQLEEALGRQRDTEEVLGHILVDLGAVSERDRQEAWGSQLGRACSDLAACWPKFWKERRFGGRRGWPAWGRR